MKQGHLRERKTMPAWTKDIDGRTVIGITAVTGNVDDGGDRIIAGAFRKTIAENARRFRHLWQHGADGWDYGVTPPVAAIKSIQEIGRDALPAEVLSYAPDATGGLEVGREYLNTERGNEILACYQAKIELEMSIGFNAITTRRIEDDTQRAAMDHWRDLIEVRLFDTSDVNWGMNSATLGSKSLEQRLAILTDRLLLLNADELATVEAPLLLAFRAACAKYVPKELWGSYGQDELPTQPESRAEPAPARISLTPSLKRLRELELALIA